MNETPRPDPWADVERWSVTGTYVERMRVKFAGSSIGEWMRSAEVDAARAADAARHQAEIAALNGVIREHLEFGGLFQPGGRFHHEATVKNLLFGQSAVVSGGRWLVEQYDAQTQEIATLRATGGQQAETIRQLRDWQATVTASLGREGGTFYDDVPKHIREMRAQIATLTQERDEARAEATRNVLRYTVRGFTAGENADSKAWRERAEAAEARITALEADCACKDRMVNELRYSVTHDNLVNAERRITALEAALKRLRDCDWTIGRGDRMDPVREIARQALETP